MRKLRALQSKAAPKNSLLPTIESSNPELARALLLLAMHESAENHRLAASAYRKAGVLDFAYRHFQRAVVLEPCDGVSYDGMARLWRDWGMPDLALSDVHRALNCTEKSAEIYNTLGTILESLGQPRSAERAYRSAVGAQPARHVRAEQPVLPPDDVQATRPPRAASARRHSRSTRTSPPHGTTSRSWRRSAGTWWSAEKRLRERPGKRRLALQRWRPASHRAAVCRGGARVRPGGGGTTFVDHRAPAIRAGASGRASGGAEQ